MKLFHIEADPELGAAYLDRLADMVGNGHVLEIGSGPGCGRRSPGMPGYACHRGPDATPAFIVLSAAGHDARLVDVRAAPHQAVLADGVLLHLTRTQFEDVLRRARQAVADDGVLGFTLREGDGAAWRDDKLAVPRYSTYWREPPVCEVAHGSAGLMFRPFSSTTSRAGQSRGIYVLARVGPCPLGRNATLASATSTTG